MSDQYINRSIDLTNTNEQTLYTVPTAQITQPPQEPTTSIVKSIVVCNDSGGAVTLTITILEKSLGPATVTLFHQKSIGAGETVELISQPLVLEDSEQLKVQASSGNALHVISSILEIT